MNRLTNFLKFIIYSISLSAIISSLLSLNLWLDMRVHSKYVVYVSFIFIAITFWIKKFRKFKETNFLIAMDILFLFVIIFGKFNRISYELRDAFKIPMEIKYFKILILMILTVGNIMIFYSDKDKLRE